MKQKLFLLTALLIASLLQAQVVSTLAGGTTGYQDGTGSNAQFYSPYGIAVDANGNVYLADTNNNRIRKITSNGTVTTLAGSVAGYQDGTGTSAMFDNPMGIALDATGNLYVTDTFNNRIRKITPAGTVTTLAGSTAGYRDGTGTSAMFDSPYGIAVDANGNIYVADYNIIRKITPTGTVSTLAGSTAGYKDGMGSSAMFDSPAGIAVDANGYIYVADAINTKIRKITPTGTVSTLAGSTPGYKDGMGSSAMFDSPNGLIVDKDGNVFVTDLVKNVIRKITPAGEVSTIAGSTSGFKDGTVGTAQFSGPSAITLDNDGNLYVADSNNNRVRKITFPSCNLTTSITRQSNVSCNGGINGSATVSVSGGTGTYTYSWAPSGGTGSTASRLSAGTYTCTVTDANGCQAVQSITITQPTPLLATASQTNVSCNGGTNGSATVSMSGGTGNYTYSWSPSGGTAPTASGLSAGINTCTVTDENGCQVVQSFTITQPAPLLATASQTDLVCNSVASGSATVIVSGGTGDYTYLWAPNGGKDATASGLLAGNYLCRIRDANGCQIIQSFTITEPAALSITASQTNVSCKDKGSASVTVSGGSGGYTYLWAPSGGTDATASGLLAGDYTCTVTDSKGCQVVESFTITEPVALSITPSQTNATCRETYTGSATVNVSGGIPGYTYLWFPKGGTAATASGLYPGNYSCRVTDANGCQAVQEFTITQPSALLATGSQTNVNCNGDTNGSATVNVSGGTAPYTYLWTPNGATSPTAAGLSAGNYTCTITDANGCKVTKDFTITQPAPFLVTGNNNSILCHGDASGLATVSVSGGTGNYTYLWAPTGGTAATASGLTAGNYTCTVTDANGCQTTKSFTIEEPAQITFSDSTLPDYDYNTPYSKLLETIAGAGPKNFTLTSGSLPKGFSLLSNGQITGTSTQTADSNFTVTATDMKKCSASYNFTLKLSQIPIKVTVLASQGKVYGENDPVLTFKTIPNLLQGDSFTGTLGRSPGENVGTYAIDLGTLSAGSKYLIDFAGADFSITKANQNIIWDQTSTLGCDKPTAAVTLTAATSSGLQTNYTSSNTNIATVSNNILTFKGYGTVSITASQKGNTNYNAAAPATLTFVNSQPNLIRKHFENMIFFDNSSKEFKSYSWYKNGILIPEQTDQYFKDNAPLNGTYHAVATKTDGTFVTTCPLTLSTSQEEEYIKIVPNPVRTNTNYQLITNVSASGLQNARIEVYSTTGVLMETKNTNENTVSLKAPASEGIYIVKMTLTNGKYFTKNLLVRN